VSTLRHLHGHNLIMIWTER